MFLLFLRELHGLVHTASLVHLHVRTSIFTRSRAVFTCQSLCIQSSHVGDLVTTEPRFILIMCLVQTLTLQIRPHILPTSASAAILLPSLLKERCPTRWHNTRASASRIRLIRRPTKQTTSSEQKATKTKNGDTSTATGMQTCSRMSNTTCLLPASNTATMRRAQACSEAETSPA